MNKGYINEIFPSYQGEGKYIGARQLFIRLAGCNIGCKGCDTNNQIKNEFYIENVKINNPIDATKLVKIIKKHYNLETFHSISITGGEPLEQFDFLKLLAIELKKNKVKLFLETSGFYPKKLLNVETLFDILSIDVKIKTSFDVDYDVELFDILKNIAQSKYYLKIIISNRVDLEELSLLVKLLKELSIKEIYIQPYNDLLDGKLLDNICDLFALKGINGFYVPQVHKLIRMR